VLRKKARGQGQGQGREELFPAPERVAEALFPAPGFIRAEEEKFVPGTRRPDLIPGVSLTLTP